MTFFLMGIPGVLLALLVKLTVQEPRTQHSVQLSAPIEPSKLADVLRMLWKRKACRNLSIALVLFYTMGLGMAPWQAAFMMRSHGMSTAELGLWMGLILGLGGIAGVLLGGYIASRFFGNDERGQMRFTALVVASLSPCYIAFLLVPTRHAALAAFIPLTIVFNFFLAPSYALLQRLVPDEMRATVMAVVMLFANLIGMGIGPQVVGILSDLFRPTLGDDALRYAMLAVSFVALWSARHFWKVSRTVRAELPA